VVDAGSGTAMSGTDYSAFGTQTVSFSNGAVSGAARTVSLTPVGDTLPEGSETVALRLQNLTTPAGLSASLGNTANTTTIKEVGVDLAVTQTESIDPVVAGPLGGTLTYVVTVRNIGDMNATSVTLREDLTLVPGVTLASLVPSVGFYVTTAAPDGIQRSSASSTRAPGLKRTSSSRKTAWSSVVARNRSQARRCDRRHALSPAGISPNGPFGANQRSNSAGSAVFASTASTRSRLTPNIPAWCAMAASRSGRRARLIR